jgi:transposase
VTRHHRFLLQLHLQQIDGLDASLGALDREIEANLAPFCIAVDIVSTHPGINKLSAEAIVSEIGADLSRFATAGHLLSWAHLCPRNDESAGKRRSSRLRQGGRWLKTTLVQCAHAAKNKRGSYYQAQYLRLRSRRGPQKAVCAVAASILTAIYHMLKNGTVYQDLGADHFSRRSKETPARSLLRRLKHMGYAVQIEPLAA